MSIYKKLLNTVFYIASLNFIGSVTLLASDDTSKSSVDLYNINDDEFTEKFNKDSRDKKITEISITGLSKKLTFVSMPLLNQQLLNHKFVQVLSLTDNNIGAEGAIILSKNLHHCENLSMLNLAGNNIGHEGAKELCQAVKVHKSITSLVARGNNIGNQGAVYFADLIQGKNLKELYLQRNNIDSSGNAISLISEALKNNTALSSFYINYNNIGDQGAIILSNALSNNRSLNELGLENNNISDKSASAFYDLLQKNKTLIKISLLDKDTLYNKIRWQDIMCPGENCNTISSTYAKFIDAALFRNETLSQESLQSKKSVIKEEKDFKDTKVAEMKCYNTISYNWLKKPYSEQNIDTVSTETCSFIAWMYLQPDQLNISEAIKWQQAAFRNSDESTLKGIKELAKGTKKVALLYIIGATYKTQDKYHDMAIKYLDAASSIPLAKGDLIDILSKNHITRDNEDEPQTLFNLYNVFKPYKSLEAESQNYLKKAAEKNHPAAVKILNPQSANRFSDIDDEVLRAFNN